MGSFRHLIVGFVSWTQVIVRTESRTFKAAPSHVYNSRKKSSTIAPGQESVRSKRGAARVQEHGTKLMDNWPEVPRKFRKDRPSPTRSNRAKGYPDDAEETLHLSAG